MTSEIRSLPLGKVCALIYRYPSFYGMEKHSEGVPVVRGEHLMPDGTISTNWDDYWFVAPEVSERYPKTVLALDDVVMSVRGTVGAFARVGKEHVGAQISPNLIRLSPDPKVLVPRYLFYALRFPGIKEAILGGVASSAVPALKASDIKRTCILVPPLADQQRIVEILGGIDDWIDLLKQETVTLEAIARAIFKSWFIDFDPVRAKAEGREPRGVDVHTAALLPNGFDETGRSAVPRGWRRGVLGDILFDSTERVGSRSIPVLSAVNGGELVPSREFFHKRVHSRNTSHYKLVPPFAFAYNPSRINIGSIGLNETGQDGAVSPVYVVCKPVSVPVAYYVWHLLRTPAIREWINVLSSGTVRQNLTYRDFASIRIVIPPDELLERFFLIRSTLYRRVAHNERMIRTLTQLRDELLPRLISSKLRVPEAEEALKEVL